MRTFAHFLIVIAFACAPSQAPSGPPTDARACPDATPCDVEPCGVSEIGAWACSTSLDCCAQCAPENGANAGDELLVVECKLGSCVCTLSGAGGCYQSTNGERLELDACP